MREISDEGRLKQRRGEIDITKPWNYKPWLHTRDCRRGHGTRHIIRDLFYIYRLIYLMSDLEKKVYYTLRTRLDVIEIFEQYPLLPISETEEICNIKHISHPRKPGSKKNNTMTTDFLILKKNTDGKVKFVACAVKPSSQLKNKRVKQKLFIEEKYWEQKGIEFGVMTEKDVNAVYVKNVILCRSGYIGLGDRSIYDCIKYLIVNNLIEVNMYEKIDLDKIAADIKRGVIKVEKSIFNAERYIEDERRELVDISEIRNILFNN